MRQLGQMLDPPVKERTVHMWETGKYSPKSPRREQIIEILSLQNAIPDAPPATPMTSQGTIGMTRVDLIESLLKIRSEVDNLLGRL